MSGFAVQGWQWVVLAAEFVAVVFAADWARRDLKWGGRRREWKLRVERRRDDLLRGLPAHERVDYLAALVCARENGDLLVEDHSRLVAGKLLRFPVPR